MIDLYPWFRIISSVLVVGLATAHAVDASWARRHYHDDRSALELLRSLTLLGVGVGLLISASAAFLTGLDVATRQDIRNFGLGMASGVMVVWAVVTAISDRDRDTRGAS